MRDAYERFQRSNLSQQAFCQAEGISKGKFNYWCRQFKQRSTLAKPGVERVNSKVEKKKLQFSQLLALGRKNYLFAGSHSAAQKAAMLYSFLGSCQRDNLNPHEWLSDILAKLNSSDYKGKFSDLLSNRWRN